MTAYSIVLPNGKVHNFNAATWAEAVVIAKNWGVPESGIQGTGGAPTTTPTTTPETEEATGKPQWLKDLEELKENKRDPLYPEYLRYKDFLQTAEGQGYPVPQDFADYKRIKAAWGEQEQPPIEQNEYALDPEEAARRREEAYAESRYAAEERYHEAPRYQETFSKWIQGQGNVSGALQQYIQSKYPSLRAEFESGISREVGFPTREEARTEAAQREAGWQSWLSQRMPETRQDYWGQRPSDRGERYYMYAPTTKTVNW